MSNFKGMIKGVLISYLLAFVLLAAYSFALVYTNLSEGATMPIVTVITIATALLCGLIGGRSAGSRGYVYGGLSGLIYAVVLWVFGSVVLNDYNMSFGFAILLLLGIFSGALGGMIGVNIKNNR